MAFTGKQRAFCVLEFSKFELVMLIQRAFYNKYQKQRATDKTIHLWYRKFKETGCLCDGKQSGWPRPSADTINRVREKFLRSPKKLTTSRSIELGISQPTVRRILQNVFVWSHTDCNCCKC